MLFAVLTALALAQDPAGDAPPAPLQGEAAVQPDAKPVEPRLDDGGAAPADPDEPKVAPRAPAPDKKREAASGEPPNKLLAAGLAAGITCLAAPSIWCCSSGILCAWLPCLLTPGLAAGGATAGLLASGAGLDPLTIGAAAGVGAGGALVAAGIGIPASLIFTGAAGTQAGNPATSGALNLGFLAVWSGVAALVSLGTAAGVGAAVYFLMPDGEAIPSDAKGGKDAVEADARAGGARDRFAMAY